MPGWLALGFLNHQPLKGPPGVGNSKVQHLRTAQVGSHGGDWENKSVAKTKGNKFEKKHGASNLYLYLYLYLYL